MHLNVSTTQPKSASINTARSSSKKQKWGYAFRKRWFSTSGSSSTNNNTSAPKLSGSRQTSSESEGNGPGSSGSSAGTTLHTTSTLKEEDANGAYFDGVPKLTYLGGLPQDYMGSNSKSTFL
uniref:PH domain-containing protein n=1 Tax=Rhabditophanes sp. KR3021 TaxID=114890 RepID=A0AC35TUC5_9BILA